jgi:hypothetical protein
LPFEKAVFELTTWRTPELPPPMAIGAIPQYIFYFK